MSSSPEGDLVNGHLSPDPTNQNGAGHDQQASDSDLSDLHNEAAAQPSPSPSDAIKDVSNRSDDEQDMSESDVPTPDNASEDAEFDMQDSPRSRREVIEDRDSSSDSNRVPKRKAAAVEEEYMRANPALYGLRRSVRVK